MSPSRKLRLFEWWFSGWVRRRLGAVFEAVRVSGLERLACAAADHPLVVVANHVCFWDSLLAIALVTDRLRLDGYALMEASSLRRYPFLGRVGGFGIERGVQGEGAAVVAYAASLLDRPGRIVWVYPEGREQPAGRRPLAFKRGAASISSTAPGARWVPVSVQYVFGAQPKPTVWIAIGEAMAPMGTADEVAEAQARAVEAGLDSLDRAVAATVDTGRPPEAFRTVIQGRRGRLGAWATTALGWLTRRRADRRPPRRGLGDAP